MKNVRVVQFDSNLTIHGKYFGKRILYYEDGRFSGTDLEGVTILNFQFITLQNKTKYTFDINYFGDDKSLSQLVGLFDTIGGSIKFD
jgi:type IV secretory pathway protease TraF